MVITIICIFRPPVYKTREGWESTNLGKLEEETKKTKEKTKDKGQKKMIRKLLLWLRVSILRLITFFTQSVAYGTQPSRIGNATNTILLMGDGNAEGVGDQLGHTGLVEQLNSHLRKCSNENLTAASDILRMKWRVVTSGRFHTNSKHWLPGNIDSMFSKSLMNHNPSIVILMLGSDYEENSDDMIENILRIIQSLIDDKRMVIIPGVPNYYGENERYSIGIELRKRIKQLHDKDGHGDSVVVCDGKGDLSKICALGEDVISKSDDLCTLNARGYRLLGADMFQDVAKLAKKVEWTFWKKQLYSQSRS